MESGKLRAITLRRATPATPSASRIRWRAPQTQEMAFCLMRCAHDSNYRWTLQKAHGCIRVKQNQRECAAGTGASSAGPPQSNRDRADEQCTAADPRRQGRNRDEAKTATKRSTG